MDLVVLDQVVVAAELDRVVGPVVDEVVGNPNTYPVDADRRTVRAIQASKVVDVVVLRVVAGRGKSLAITATE